MSTPSSRAPSPANRQLDLDVSRGVCVVAMVAVHALLTLGTPEAKATPAGTAVALGGSVAGIFVTLMGVFMAWSPVDAASTAATVRRGVATWLLGYLLNVLRFVVPYALWDGIPPAYLADLGLPPGDSPVGFLLLFGDILQFAGVAMIVIAPLRAARPRPMTLLVLATLVSALAPVGWSASFAAGPALAHLAGLVTGADPAVRFPLLPWLTFPLVGLAVGQALRPTAGFPAGRLGTGRLFAIGAALFVAGFLGSLVAPAQMADHYRLGLAGMVHYVGYVLMFLAAVRAIAIRVTPGPVTRLLVHCGQHVTRVYLVQWVLVCWAIALVGYRALSGVGVAVVTAAILAISLAIVALWARFDSLGRRAT
jgi:uncharacterized membrane protein